MKYRLMKMELSGIKNISKPMTINFLGDTIARNRKLSAANSNVKAIFGPNGSGKSAIMNAVDMYIEMTTNYAFFLKEGVDSRVSKLINKITNVFSITMYFAITADDDTIVKVLSHKIAVAKKADRLRIIEESICEYRGASLNSECEVMLCIKDGVIRELVSEPGNGFTEIISGRLLSVADVSSVVSFVDSSAVVNDLNTKIKNLGDRVVIADYSKAFDDIITIYMAVNNVQVYLDEADEHRNLINAESLKLMQDYLASDIAEGFVDVTEDVIEKSEYDNYINQIRNLTSFIQIFKPELLRIDINCKEDHSMLHVTKEFVYDGYRVDEEFESAGIRKLIQLFSFLDAASNGGIVFIDEMDTNINDVYLRRLVEYFVSYGKGQLVFTTHNLSPMEVLRKVKRGIDFINPDNEDITWIKNGNYSPEKQYSEGYIPGIPYNSEAFDFLKCFGKLRPVKTGNK